MSSQKNVLSYQRVVHPFCQCKTKIMSDMKSKPAVSCSAVVDYLLSNGVVPLSTY